MNLNHTFAVRKGRQTASGNGRVNQEYNDGLAPWKRAVATPLFGWKPTQKGTLHDQEIKKPQIILIQGELFLLELAAESFLRPKPSLVLEA